MKVSIIPFILKKLKQGLGIVQDTDTATQVIAKDKYVFWKGSVKKASSAISQNDTLSASNLSDVTDGALNALNDQIVPSYQVLETGLTIIRIGRIRILSCFGMDNFTDGGTYTLPAGDAPNQHVTSSCYVTDSTYYKIRIGRIYVEDGKLYARAVSDYNTANKGMLKINAGDKVYGEIIYTT